MLVLIKDNVMAAEALPQAYRFRDKLSTPTPRTKTLGPSSPIIIVQHFVFVATSTSGSQHRCECSFGCLLSRSLAFVIVQSILQSAPL